MTLPEHHECNLQWNDAVKHALSLYDKLHCEGFREWLLQGTVRILNKCTKKTTK
jgi:hypothetical protein